MRTEEQFAATYNTAKWFTRYHNKPVWLVPRENEYAISVIKPEGRNLPRGTSAVLYNQNMEIIDKVNNY